MKKMLIGIVTLVATVVLISPAFGALDNPYENLSDPNAVFTFWKDVDMTERSSLEAAFDLSDLGNAAPATIIAALPESWGEEITLDKEYTTGWGNSGSFTLDAPVQIVSAKWDGIQYAFLFNDYARVIEWDGLVAGMSNIRGYNAVPVPAAVWLLGSGVLGLVAIRRRRS